MLDFAAGVHDWSEEEYLADTHCPEPSLNASAAKIMIERSPLHAWVGNRRLNDQYVEATGRSFNLGRAAHTYYLKKGRDFSVIPAQSFSEKNARAARDDAEARGLTPLLHREFQGVKDMVEAGRFQLSRHRIGDIFAAKGGENEVSLAWEGGGVWNRARVDRLFREERIAYDLKTTAASAHPNHLPGIISRYGYDMQAAHYLHGLQTVFGGNWRFRFIVQEALDPFLLSVVELTSEWLDTASRKLNKARETWRYCLDHNTWPGYPNVICTLEPPKWAESDWYEREIQEAQVKRETGRDAIEFMMEWQAPTK